MHSKALAVAGNAFYNDVVDQLALDGSNDTVFTWLPQGSNGETNNC
jgi:hypothetical protein